jgi:hypothetical protein
MNGQLSEAERVQVAIAVCYADAFVNVDLHESSLYEIDNAKNKFRRNVEEHHPELKERAQEFLIER